MQVPIYCCTDIVEYNSHTRCYKALLEEFTLLPSHQEQQPLPTKPAQAHRGRVCHRAYHYNWKWHMQRWEVGGRKGWRRRKRRKNETEGEAGGKIHWQQWNNRGSERVGKWGNRTKGQKHAGRRTVIFWDRHWSVDVTLRGNITCASFNSVNIFTVILLSSSPPCFPVADMPKTIPRLPIFRPYTSLIELDQAACIACTLKGHCHETSPALSF